MTALPPLITLPSITGSPIRDLCGSQSESPLFDTSTVLALTQMACRFLTPTPTSPLSPITTPPKSGKLPITPFSPPSPSSPADSKFAETTTKAYELKKRVAVLVPIDINGLQTDFTAQSSEPPSPSKVIIDHSKVFAPVAVKASTSTSAASPEMPIPKILSFEAFKIKYEQDIMNHTTDIPKDLGSLDNYVKKGQPKSSLKSEKLELRKKKLEPSFLKARQDFWDERFQACYNLYRNAASKDPGKSVPVILGDSSLTKDIEMLRNFGAISGGESTTSGRFKNLPSDTIGGINCEARWDITKNDMFIMGAISTNKCCYIHKFARIPLESLWNSEKDIPRVLFREIFFLIMNEYQVDSRPSLGIGFAPSLDHLYGKKESCKYSDIIIQLSKIRSKADVENFCKTHEIPTDMGAGPA